MKFNFEENVKKQSFTKEELKYLLKHCDDESLRKEIAYYARQVADEVYGKAIYMRGLVEFSNYCRNDCYYCGIRCSNQNVSRYRLDKEEILACFDEGYKLGFKSFVMQSGEDFSYKDEDLCEIITKMKQKYPDCALTLSIGEKSFDSYQKYKACGVDRFLLRHETINKHHYELLHPNNMSQANRIRCLNDLKALGYQVGCGIMVGSPYQSIEHIIEDLMFMKAFNPHMIGVGPFIPHHQTPFKEFKQGSLNLTLMILSIIRIMLPKVLLPSTTALGSIHEYGRELGILAGCNVVMPNLSPYSLRKQYSLYDNKRYSGSESAQCLEELNERFKKIGYHLESSRGDYKGE